MVKLSGLAFKEVMLGTDNADARAELLLLSPSMLVPCLSHGKVKVWDTLAIGEYLNEIAPKAQLLPTNVVHRAHCRAICGEMHSGFAAMRASLPMNIKARIKSFKVWSLGLAFAIALSVSLLILLPVGLLSQVPRQVPQK